MPKVSFPDLGTPPEGGIRILALRNSSSSAPNVDIGQRSCQEGDSGVLLRENRSTGLRFFGPKAVTGPKW
eukprot:13989156-Alexandrium_andersonii.AAC.1